MRAVITLALGAAFGVMCAYSASPGYQFTIVAQPGDTIAGKTLTSLSNPVINNAGTVAFYGTFAGGSGIFTATDLLAQPATSSFRLTDTGQLVFSNGSSIFTPSQVLVQAGDVVAGKTLTSFDEFAINNAGELVFAGGCQPPVTFPNGDQFPCQAIFTTTDLVVLATAYGGGHISALAINDEGMLVFARSYGLIPINGIFTPSETIAEAANTPLDYPAVNNSGTVVYWGQGDLGGSFIGGQQGFFVWAPPADSGYQPTSIAGHTLCSVLPAPAMNSAGTVIFGAVFQTSNAQGQCTSYGLFTASELLIQAGDTVGGKTLAPSMFSSPIPHPVNDSGAIVFLANFTDGTSGIVLATPINSGIPGDVNGDGVVDCTDIAIVRASFGKNYGQAGFNPRADVNNDGVIDILDLAFVAQHISAGASCP